MTDAVRLPPSQQFEQSGVMVILRASSADRFVEVATTLVEAGITCLEVTLTTPGALDAIGAVRSALPDSVDVGAGTVTTVESARAAVAAGAGFVVSPSVDVHVVAAAVAAGVPSYPGAFTPTEILTAWQAGASAVKLFPAAALGPSYLGQVRAPLPQVDLMPTGGVGLDDVGAWIRAGAVGVGLGSALLGDAADGGSLDALSERAVKARHAVASAREERA